MIMSQLHVYTFQTILLTVPSCV